MPNYIATVWHNSSTGQAVDGDAGLRRHVIRLHAEDERDYRAQVRDRWIDDVDADVSFGPISLSNDQSTIY